MHALKMFKGMFTSHSCTETARARFLESERDNLKHQKIIIWSYRGVFFLFMDERLSVHAWDEFIVCTVSTNFVTTTQILVSTT